MRRPNAARAALVAVLGLLASSASAGRHTLPSPTVDPLSGTTLTLSTCFWDPPPTGMFALRVEIENDHPRAYEGGARFTAKADYTTDTSSNSTVVLQVPPRSTRAFDVLVPLRPQASGLTSLNSNLTAGFDGRGVSGEPVPLFMTRHYVNPSEGERALSPWIGLSESIAVGYWEPAKAALAREGLQLQGSRFDPGCLPVDWRAYIGFAVLALTSDEWNDLAPESRLAVERWVATGGRVWLLGEPGPRRRLGFGSIEDLPHSRDFGADALAVHLTRLPETPSSYEAWSFVTQLGAPSFPKGLMLLFIVGFGLVVGPINLFALCRGRNRYRVLWTTPLLSIVASTAIAAGILLHDGTGGTGERLTVVGLLPERHEEVVLQEQVARTGLLFSSAFSTTGPLWIEPLSIDALGTVRRPSHLQRMGDAFSGDWFTSRALQGQFLASVHPSRARFAIERGAGGGSPSVVSSVPETLDHLYHVDADGRYWHAAAVAPGRRAELRQVEDREIRQWLDLRATHYGARLRATLDVSPGVVLASASRSSAPLATLRSLQWRDHETLYIQRLP